MVTYHVLVLILIHPCYLMHAGDLMMSGSNDLLESALVCSLCVCVPYCLRASVIDGMPWASCPCGFGESVSHYFDLWMLVCCVQALELEQQARAAMQVDSNSNSNSNIHDSSNSNSMLLLQSPGRSSSGNSLHHS